MAVVRDKTGRFRMTIPEGLALALGLEGGEKGRFRLLRLSSTQAVLSLETTRKPGKAGEMSREGQGKGPSFPF